VEDGKEGILTLEELLCRAELIECEVCPLREECCIIDEDQEDREAALARTALHWLEEAERLRGDSIWRAGRGPTGAPGVLVRGILDSGDVCVASAAQHDALRGDLDALRDENVSATNSLELKLAALTERVDALEAKKPLTINWSFPSLADQMKPKPPAEPSEELPTGTESLDITIWCPNCKHRFSYAGGVCPCAGCGISMRPVGPPSGFEPRDGEVE